LQKKIAWYITKQIYFNHGWLEMSDVAIYIVSTRQTKILL
jgi:hypothetical protein